MNYTHTNTLVRTKRMLALVLAVALCMNDIGQATAITYDSATATYFDSVDDLGLATASDSIGLQFGGTLGEFLRFDRASGKFIFTDDLDVQGTISGASLTIMGNASISGALTIEGGSAALSGSVLRGFGLNTDCDTAGTSKLLWDAATGRFSCGTDQGSAYTAGQGLTLTSTAFSLSQSISGTSLEFGTVSGALVYAERQFSVSGSTVLGDDNGDSIIFNGDIDSHFMPNTNNTFLLGNSTNRWQDYFGVSGNVSGTLVAGTLNSLGILDVNGTTTLDGNVSLGDATADNISFNGLVNTNILLATNNNYNLGNTSNRWVGGWFTNMNTVNVSADGTAQITGNVGIGASNTITKAALNVNGVMSGVTLYATQSFSGAGLSDCDTGGTSKLLWDATTGRFSCGTDQTGGGSLTAGQGLSLNGTTLSLSQSISGTSLEFGTVSGALVYAERQFSVSGSTVLGDDDTDNIVFNGDVNSNFVPNTNNTFALGNTSTRWQNIFTVGANVGTDLSVGGNTTLSGNVGIGPAATTTKARVNVNGVLSGVTLYATQSFSGAGLSDCDTGGTSKLLWDATTGRFSCGTDQSGGTGGGMSYETASGIFLKRSGGTMTGSLTLTGAHLDITPNLAPATMSGIDLNANVNTIFISGNYAYTVSDSVTGHEYRAIDIANPNAPVIVGGFDTGQNTKALFVSTRHVFIGMNGTGAGSGMYILDNGDPGTPTVVGRLNFGWAVNAIYVSGKYAYVALNAATSGVCAAKYQLYSGCDFAIVDFTDPNRPRIIGGLQIGANVNQMHIQNRYAYLAVDSVSGNDFRIIDIANPLSPIAVGGLDVTNNVKSVYASGKYAYIGLSTDASTEFRVIDVSSKTSPTSIGGVEVGSAVQSIIVTGDWARIGLASVAGNDLFTIDLRTPTTPRLYGGIDFGAGVNDVMVAGKYAYVGLTTIAMNDFRIIDLAGIEAPSATIGSLATGHLFASDNVRFDNNAYIRNALNVGRGGIISKGALSVQATGTGSAKGGTGQLLNAFDVRNGTGQHLFSVSENGTVQGGIPSFATGTTMLAYNMMSRRSGFCNPLITTATTYTSVGMSTCTVNGTATAWPVGGRMKLKMAAANTASAMGGITTVFTETRPQFRPKILFDVTTGTGTTGLRFYGGIVESSTAALALTVGSAATGIDYAALAWEDGISGTQWLCCSGDGTNHSCQSMGVPVQTNTEYMGQVDWSQPGKVTCQLQVRDKTYRTTKTTNISVNNVSLGESVVLVNKSIGGATARVMYNSRLVLEQN